MEVLLSPKEVARVIGVCVETLERWRREPDFHGLPFFQDGKVIRYRPEDVKAYIISRMKGLRQDGD